MISLSKTCFICLFFIGSLAEGDPTPGERLLGMEKSMKDKERDRRNLQFGGYPLMFDEEDYEPYMQGLPMGSNGLPGMAGLNHPSAASMRMAGMPGLNIPGTAAMGSITGLTNAGSASFPTMDLEDSMDAEDMFMNNMFGAETIADMMNDFNPYANLPMSAMNSMGGLPFPMGMQLGGNLGSTSSDRKNAEEAHMNDVFGAEGAHEMMNDEHDPAVLAAMMPSMVSQLGAGTSIGSSDLWAALDAEDMEDLGFFYHSMLDDSASFAAGSPGMATGSGMRHGMSRGRRALWAGRRPSYYDHWREADNLYRIRMMRTCRKFPDFPRCSMYLNKRA